MRGLIIIAFLVCYTAPGTAQRSHHDSINEIMLRDSLEYAKQLQDADRIKYQADSMLKSELGQMQPIEPADSAATGNRLRQLAAAALAKQQQAEERKYYFFAGAVCVLIIIVVIAFRRKQFAKDTNTKQV